jgi:hypothetical protein
MAHTGKDSEGHAEDDGEEQEMKADDKGMGVRQAITGNHAAPANSRLLSCACSPSTPLPAHAQREGECESGVGVGPR